MIQEWIYILYFVVLSVGFVRGFENQLRKDQMNDYLMFNDKYLCPEVLSANAGQVICNDLMLDQFEQFLIGNCPPNINFVQRSFNCPDPEMHKLKDCLVDNEVCSQSSKCVKVICTSTTPTLALDVNSILEYGTDRYVCDSSSTFGDFEALAVCKELGQVNFSTYKKTSCPGNVEFSIKNLECGASETSFTECTYSENLQGCSSSSCIQIHCSDGVDEDDRPKNRNPVILIIIISLSCFAAITTSILCYMKCCKKKPNSEKYIDNEQAKEPSSQNQLQNDSPQNQHPSQQQLWPKNQALNQESATGSQLSSMINQNQVIGNLSHLNYPANLQNASGASSLHGLPVIQAFQGNPNFQGLQVAPNLQNSGNSQNVSYPQGIQNMQDAQGQQVIQNLQDPQNLQILQAQSNLQGLPGLQGVSNFQILPNLQNVQNRQNVQNLSEFQHMQLLQYIQLQNQQGQLSFYPQNAAFFMNHQQQPQSLNQSSLPLQQQMSLENQAQINPQENQPLNLEQNEIKFPSQENNINIENPNGELQQQQIIQQQELQEQEKDDPNNRQVQQYNYPPVENVKPKDYQMGLNYNQLL